MAAVVTFEALEESELDGLLDEEKAQERRGRPIRCAHCGHGVSSADQRIELAGAHAHRFENPAGITFEIGCFRHAPGCRSIGEATMEHTWFPGHAWSIGVCARCGTHLGWAYGPSGAGSAFYGLILDRLAEEM